MVTRILGTINSPSLKAMGSITGQVEPDIKEAFWQGNDMELEVGQSVEVTHTKVNT